MFVASLLDLPRLWWEVEVEAEVEGLLAGD